MLNNVQPVQEGSLRVETRPVRRREFDPDEVVMVVLACAAVVVAFWLLFGLY